MSKTEKTMPGPRLTPTPNATSGLRRAVSMMEKPSGFLRVTAFHGLKLFSGLTRLYQKSFCFQCVGRPTAAYAGFYFCRTCPTPIFETFQLPGHVVRQRRSRLSSRIFSLFGASCFVFSVLRTLGLIKTKGANHGKKTERNLLSNIR